MQNSLLIATYEPRTDRGSIWFFDGKPKILATRDDYIMSLVSDGNRIYDASGGRIYNTLEDPEGKQPLTECKVQVWAMCMHDDILYAVADSDIFLPFTDPSCHAPVVKQSKPCPDGMNTNSSVGAKLFMHNDRIFYAQDCRISLINNHQAIKIATRGWHIKALLSFEGTLCDIVSGVQGSSDLLFKSLKERKGKNPFAIILPQEQITHVCCVNNEELYGANYSGELFKLVEQGMYHFIDKKDKINGVCRFEPQQIYAFNKSITTLCAYQK